YPDDADQRAIREQELMKRAIEYIELMVPEDLNIDYNQDDLVDNVCFVVRGDIGDWSDLLWPHRWSLYWTEAYLHGKRVYDYNFQLADAEPYFTNSVMSHEMFHSLGAPDLYHYADPAHLEPVGPWDLMAANTNPPQQTNAYMKYKYGKWIDEIPELTEYGTYTLYPLNSQQNLPKYYKIATQNPDEFFLLEYRRKRQPFDDQIFDSGLMIYRINTSFSGNASYNGFDILDEVYVFRYGGDLYTNGTISAAPFRQNSVRRSFTTNSNPHAFLSNGDPVEILIDHITIPSDSIQFDYNFYVGMENFQKDETISIYPNPTTDDITIKAKSLNMNNIQVYDIFGKLIIETKINQNQAVIHLTDYPSGIYLIKITDQNNNIKTLKAVKQSF
ncbi:MAG: T9SS type A sorting domain-containing protein, partial [Bacteroidales bacterium]